MRVDGPLEPQVRLGETGSGKSHQKGRRGVRVLKAGRRSPIRAFLSDRDLFDEGFVQPTSPPRGRRKDR